MCKKIVIGRWNIDIKLPKNVDKRILQCFKCAVEDITGASYDLRLYLGSQLVNGINYAFLCKQTIVGVGVQKKLVIVVVNKNLEGECRVVSVKPIL